MPFVVIDCTHWPQLVYPRHTPRSLRFSLKKKKVIMKFSNNGHRRHAILTTLVCRRHDLNKTSLECPVQHSEPSPLAMVHKPTPSTQDVGVETDPNWSTEQRVQSQEDAEYIESWYERPVDETNSIE